MTSKLGVPVAVNIDSGTINLPLIGKSSVKHAHALASVVRRTGPPREMAA